MKQPNHYMTGACPAGRRQKGFLSSRQALVLLGLIFLAPTFVAWLMHTSGEGGWRPDGTTNQGTLIQPPRSLALPAGLVDMSGELVREDYLQGKWTLLYIGGAKCGEACRKNLYHLRQVRLAQGDQIKRVQRLYLYAETASRDALGEVLKEYSGMVSAGLTAGQSASLAPLFLVDGTPMQEAERIYLVDPHGNLMMYYRADDDPRGIIKDLQKLLKYSRIG